MSIAERPARPRGEDLLTLGGNGMQVKMLQSALHRAEMNTSSLPQLIVNIYRARTKDRFLWQRYVFADNPDYIYEWSAGEFRKFIESPRSEGGCETPLHVMELILRPVEDADVPEDPRRAEAWVAFNEMVRGMPGAPPGPEAIRNPSGSNQWTKCDVITLSPTPPPMVPIPAEVEPAARRKPPTGTSTSYTLRQLAKGKRTKDGVKLPARPDLLERVKAGEITPNKAIILAGYRDPMPKLPKDPVRAGKLVRRYFVGPDWDAFLEAAGIRTLD